MTSGKEMVMPVATLTSKGQVTIPKSVRESLHLRTGDRIEFVVHGPTEALLRPITKSVDGVFGRLHDGNQPALTVQEMDAAIAGQMKSQQR
jgi:antitoxin PrlF